MGYKSVNEKGALLVEWVFTLAFSFLICFLLIDIGVYYVKSLIVSDASSAAANYLRVSTPNRAGSSDDTSVLETGLKNSVLRAAGGVVNNTGICASQGSSLPLSNCLNSRSSLGIVNAARAKANVRNNESYWVNIGVGVPFKGISGFLPTNVANPLNISNSVGVRVSKEPPRLNIDNCVNGQQLVYDETSHTMSCQDTFGGVFTRYVCSQDRSTANNSVGFGCRAGNPALANLNPRPSDPCSCPPNFTAVAVARWSNYSGSGPCREIYYEGKGSILFVCVIGNG